ncbi:nucleotidyltransferase domain-containing protein [Marinobacter shengliensis]|jgi:predicted nucleotidyltransferase|uniref:nucleotidyltransferase domain-containing protein n=1 Tax=Marinobacter shengliensis TaxID=1389223 RepID=UPI00257379D4|nr:nucleotidyltransferase domain-containing protein [Marinobacter shengliensis]BEH15280.1 DNA polymerase [Marinobacter shengliensis]
MTLPETSPQADQFGLPSRVINSLKALFEKYSEIEQVTLYGSRAKGNYRHNSDIDLMLTAPTLSWRRFNNLELEIDDLLLPWKVDLALEHQVENQDLLEHVARVGVRVL